MLSNKEHEALVLLDRLLMLARENAAVNDLLSQTTLVANLIQPNPEDQYVFGPLQRLFYENTQLSNKVSKLEETLMNYKNSVKRDFYKKYVNDRVTNDYSDQNTSNSKYSSSAPYPPLKKGIDK